MKKTLLFSAFAALTLGAAAQTAVLKDVTPAGYDFSKYDDGAKFKLHMAGPDDSFAGWSPATNIYDPAWMAENGQFSTVVRRGTANNSAADLATLQNGVYIKDFGGELGKCLVATCAWGPYANGFSATGGNGAYCIGFFSDPTLHHHGWTGAAVRVRITYTIARRGCHAYKDNAGAYGKDIMVGMYCLEGNDGNYAPRNDAEVGATAVTYNGGKYAKLVGEGTTVAGMPEGWPVLVPDGMDSDPLDSHAPTAENISYYMQMERFHVVEFDTYSVGEGNPIIFCLNYANANSSLVIKEIKFFEIENSMDLLAPDGEGGYTPIPGASYFNTRTEGFRYYTTDGVKEFADGGVPRPVVAGSAENPYKISTADDLLAMHSKITANKDYYFTLLNDIDMEGVEGYVPAVTAAPFDGIIHFDGNNHVIKNLTINSEESYASIFGVLKGEVKNLGVVNCKVNSDASGSAILAGYGSHNSYAGTTTIDNVYVIGEITTEGDYSGGMIATTGNDLKITNSYARVKITSEDSGSKTTGAALLVGRVANPLTVENCYVAGKVEAQGVAGGLFGFTKNESAPTVNNAAVIAAELEGLELTNAIYTGSQASMSGVIVADNVKVEGEVAEGAVPAATAIAAVQGWDAYHTLDLVDGLPILTWQTSEAGVIGVEVDNAADAAPVYYNLQGVQVANPQNGLYIVKRGAKVSKEVIR